MFQIHKSEFPFTLPAPLEKQILHEAQYYIHRIATELQRVCEEGGYEEENCREDKEATEEESVGDEEKWDEAKHGREDKEETGGDCAEEDETKYLEDESAALVSLEGLMLRKSIANLCSLEQLRYVEIIPG